MFQKRYFTADEINTLIPQLEKLFDHVETCRSRAEELAAQAFNSSRCESGAIQDIAQTQMLRSQMEFLMSTAHQGLHDIEATGCVVKDVDAGLVDFLGDVNGQDVWLCWKRGEVRVQFWHSLDSGFSQRRALPQPQRNTTRH